MSGEIERKQYIPVAHDEYLRLLQSLFEMHERLEQLEQESLINNVSKIANDKAFEKYLAGVADRYNRLGRGNEKITILYGDLKKFKPVNDDYGDGTGNAVLRAVGQALNESTRPEEITCNMWGDSYVIVLLTTDKKAVATAKNRFTKVVARLTVNSVDMFRPGTVKPTILLNDISIDVNTPPEKVYSFLSKKHFERPRS